jgi:hypothetical protein
MKPSSKKLALKKLTIKPLTNTDLGRARGGHVVDSDVTCDLACWYWSYFTRKN